MDNDANAQKRKAEEQKLIDEIRRKRACVERASSFPSEKDLQSKIRYFVKLIVDYVRCNDLENSFTELRGTKPQLFAKREAIERIRSAAEGLSMTHELYELLVLARCASERSKRHFYREEEKGVSLEPSFTADFVRKELEFLSDLVHRMAAEVREAELQIESESYEGPLEEVKELIYELRRDLAERCLELQEKVNKQGDEIKQAVQVVNKAGGSVEVQKPDKDKNGAETAEERQRPEVHSDKEAEEDLLDLYEDGDGQQSSDDEVHEVDYAEKHREEIRKRMAELRIEIESLQYLPKRRFTQEAIMRPEEQFLRCGFCFAKGEHYSDMCPDATSVKIRKGRIKCRFCLDTLHASNRCKRKRKSCNYCNSINHHTALCDLPEQLEDLQMEYDELRNELEMIDDHSGPSTSSRREYRERE